MDRKNLTRRASLLFTIAATAIACAPAQGDPADADTDELDVREGGPSDGDHKPADFDGAPGDEPAAPCLDDVFEANDSFGFPAEWNGDPIGAVACPHNPDFYRLEANGPWSKVVVHQAGDTTGGDDNLLLEVYCDLELCDADESRTQSKAVSLAECECSVDDRVFVHVVNASAQAPSSGTPYRLRLQ